MRTEDDDVSALQGDERFVDRGRRRIRRWNDRGHDTNRARDLEDLLFFVLADDADGFHRPNRSVHIIGAEEVLQRLVFDGSIARLFDGKLCKGFSMGDTGLGDFEKDAFDLIFRKVFKLQPCFMRGMEQTSSFLYRFEIFVHERLIPVCCRPAWTCRRTNDVEFFPSRRMDEE
jgi:hypothetical protein